MLDYSSGSFTDFILGDQADLAGPGPPLPEPVGPGPAELAEPAGSGSPGPAEPGPAEPGPAEPGPLESVPGMPVSDMPVPDVGRCRTGRCRTGAGCRRWSRPPVTRRWSPAMT